MKSRRTLQRADLGLWNVEMNLWNRRGEILRNENRKMKKSSPIECRFIQLQSDEMIKLICGMCV